MGAGQRVTAIQPGLVVTPNVGGPTAQEGLAAMQQAFKQGILNYDDILDGLTVKPARREAEMGKLEADIAKQKSDKENRPLREQLEKLQLEAQTADAGVMSGIARSRADAFTPRAIEEVGRTMADVDVLGSRKRLAEIDADLRSVHDKVNDPEGLKAAYRQLVLKYEGNLRPGMTLDELRNEAQTAIRHSQEVELDKMRVEAALKASSAAGLKIEEIEGRLRAELAKRPEVSDYAKVAPMYQKVQSVADLDHSGGIVSPADDMAMIFAYMKILDPGSTVREGEYATAEKTRGIPDSIVMAYNKALAGSKLTSQQRQEFASAAERAYAPHRQAYERTLEWHRRLAKQYGVDPTRVAEADPAGMPSPPAAAPGSAVPGTGATEVQPKVDPTLSPGTGWFRLRDGRVVRGRRLPNGAIQVEP